MAPHLARSQVGSSLANWMSPGTKVLSWMTNGIWSAGKVPSAISDCSVESWIMYPAASPAYTFRRVMPYEWSW